MSAMSTAVLAFCLLATFYSPVCSQDSTLINPKAGVAAPAGNAVAVPSPAADATTAAVTEPSTNTRAPDTTTTTTTSTTTTTAKTTTTTAKTTTTTAKTTTSASTTTTTTPAPPKPLDPTQGHWSVSDDTNSQICILAKMAIQMKVPYLASTNQTLTAFLDVPINASATGSCDGAEYIQISWPDSGDDANWFRVTFVENATSGHYMVEAITARLAMTDANFPDHADDKPELSLRVNFSEPIELSANSSYRCLSRQPFQLLASDEDISAQLVLIDTQLEAFRHDNTTKFSTPLVCSADHRAASDIVPIAVGVALALLVVAILIAYVIGRRRARQRGYQSV
ncbi:lysosome-associated membrane glycoprotein 1-like [Pollicipes pollicipes]|uniref:lysosome-associated membrane glycoprotein 1-like n=1 Tax=Pollicipes pollicipes TaxID=41117 RepID=UPI0018854E19|nr:lysosome-associated membrane glycoprotein 1-like [Pollicipes pollicipes]